MKTFLYNMSIAIFIVTGIICFYLINKAKGSLIKNNIRFDGLSLVSIVKTISDNRKLIPDAWIEVVLAFKIFAFGAALAFIGLSLISVF